MLGPGPPPARTPRLGAEPGRGRQGARRGGAGGRPASAPPLAHWPRPRPPPARPRPRPLCARWPGSMAAAAGAPPPGPPQPPPPPPPEESSDSEPEAEPGSPQKLIRKVSTSGQIRQKVSPRRRPGRAPLSPRQPREAHGPSEQPPRPGPARPGVPPGATAGRTALGGVTGRAERALPAGRRGPGRGRRGAARGRAGWGWPPAGPEDAPCREDPGETEA